MITFFVPGTPKPAGSKRAFFNKKSGKAIVVDTSGKPGKDWRADIKALAYQHKPPVPWTGPIAMNLTFYFARPKSHYGTGRNCDVLKPSAPPWHVCKPDATKITRAVEDALTGIIWRDDSQIIRQVINKDYGDHEGVMVEIKEMRHP